MSWGGKIVLTTGIQVSFKFLGASETLSRIITVEPRGWSWNNSLTSGQAAAGQFDGCMPQAAAGVTVGTDCASFGTDMLLTPGNENTGYGVKEGSGPNAGLWYVDNPTKVIHARAQVRKRYRMDETKFAVNGPSAVIQACSLPNAFGTPLPPLNNYDVNLNCSWQNPPPQNTLVSTIWSHEQRHLDTISVAARESTNDLWKKWEGLVRSSQSDLVTAIKARATMSNNDILSRSSAIDSDPNATSVTFSLYLHTGGGIWSWSSVTVKN